jgi:hypothetical protein
VWIFGEREFMAALFLGYVRQLGYAGFVPRKLDDALEKQAACRGEPVADHMKYGAHRRRRGRLRPRGR